MPNNDSHQHVVKTTSQWNDRAVEYWVVPRGCLCIELTPEGKTKLKVGEGNKFYHQLPYVCEGSDLSDYYTKEEIDNIIDNINRMAIMSTDEYDSKNDLPLDGNKLGDVRFVKSNAPSISTEPDIYLWNGTKWIFVGTDISSIDLDDFVKKEEFEVVKDKVDIMYPKMHEHTNKDVLDQTTAPYTIPEKEKLAGLHNYDDTEIRELIHETGHTHPNKSLLDTITPSSLWNEADRIKFNDLHNYDDTEVIVRIETLEERSHTHSNKNILDQTTAPFKTADKEKLDSLQNYDVFRGTDGIYPGGKGLVPAPTIGDSGKFLSSSGEWLHVTVVANDFVGATPTEDGEHGLVPAPLAGQQSYYLRGDGTWQPIPGGEPLQYVRVSANDSFVLLHTKPADWDDTWYKYYMLSYDELVDEPPDWDPTRHYKYENDNYVLGSPGDTFVSTTWYDKHYNGLDPNTPIIFDSDVYYTSTLNLIQDGELLDTAFEKVNEAIEHIERLEQNVQFLHDNKVDVRKTVDPERIEFYYS